MRNQAMEDKVVDLQMHLKMSRDCTAELRAEIAQLTAERDRYKAALTKISKKNCTTWNSPCLCMSCTAREALKEAK